MTIMAFASRCDIPWIDMAGAPELELALRQFAKNLLPQSGASPDELLSQLERPLVL